MSLSEMISRMQTGMPSTRSAPKPKAKAKGSSASHLKKAHAAHKSGDAKAAKSHAFNFIKSLGSAKPPSQPAPTPATMPAQSDAPLPAPPPFDNW